MAVNTNPSLNGGIQFLDVLELFEKYNISQLKDKNFALMLEVSKLIGFTNKEDEINTIKLLTVLSSKFSES